jgi:hypothetical protein
MSNFQELLDESFVDQLGYEIASNPLPTPEMEGSDNILNYSKEYQGNGIDIIVVECKDRLIEFQKKLINNQKSFFPNAHFLFVSNNGKVFDLYNNATSSKLKKITYDEIGKSTRLFKEKLQLFDVTKSSDGTDLQINAEKAFDTSDKITKKFFDKFKKIHTKLQKAITGIEDEKDRSWYASVMMNRIMFIYFLQKHYVIQNNTDFLLQKFDEINANGQDYYKDFLLPLFFYGFARRDDDPEKVKFTDKFGPIRYLNGGLFYPHHLEKKYSIPHKTTGVCEEKALNTLLGINPKLIKEILVFLNGYTWYLDNRPMKEDTDINPDVLGYIFEKYINQKELGAYYTKEDITEYISKNTIIPFIFDKMSANGFNAPDPNPLITNNEDIIGAASHYIENIDNYEELKFLYKDVLLELSVIDPSVGSGAFLFSALNILLPIYQKTVFRLKELSKTEKDKWLNTTVSKINKHPEEYFLTKQIILNNLYGVDIVEEATEICKLRLFLQLASHLPDIKSIEPLPDIDFNIYAGNSLVGGLSKKDLQDNYGMDLFTSANWEFIEKDIETLSELKAEYRNIQQDDDNIGALNHQKNNIETLKNKINTDIKIGIDNPFHWFIDFNKIINKGGFDVIIGNPPYVEYSKIRKQYKLSGYLELKRGGNLFGFMIERATRISHSSSHLSMIVLLSLTSTGRMSPLVKLMKNRFNSIHFSHYEGTSNPGVLFTGVKAQLSIFIASNSKQETNYYTTKYLRFYADERNELFKTKLKYSKYNNEIFDLVPKVSSPNSISILEKILFTKDSKSLSFFIGGKHKLYFRNMGNFFWKLAFENEPHYSLNNVSKSSSTVSELNFESESIRDFTICLINSSIFFFYWNSLSDCYHLSKKEILKISIPSNIDFYEFNKLKEELMKSLAENCFRQQENMKNGDIRLYDKYYPQKSKLIIDMIDTKLSKVFSLSIDELNFIKDYEIKYRLGDN